MTVRQARLKSRGRRAHLLRSYRSLWAHWSQSRSRVIHFSVPQQPFSKRISNRNIESTPAGWRNQIKGKPPTRMEGKRKARKKNRAIRLEDDFFNYINTGQLYQTKQEEKKQREGRKPTKSESLSLFPPSTQENSFQ